MDRSEVLIHLIEDMERKKPLESKYDFRCAGCDEEVGEGDEFVFLGRARLCPECRDEMVAEIKEWIGEIGNEGRAEKAGHSGREK